MVVPDNPNGHRPGRADRAARGMLGREAINRIDAAVATLVKGIQADCTKLTGLGKLKGVGDPFLDEGTRVATAATAARSS